MRIIDLISVVIDHVVRLVHDSARDKARERAWHERFLLTRMTAGLFALACLPPYLLWRGVPSAVEALLVLSLATPIGAAVMLSRTGLLAVAYGVSAAALAGIVLCVASASGGLGSPAVLWLLAAPVEACLCASKRAAVTTAAVSAAGLVVLAGLELTGASTVAWPLAAVMPIILLSAIGYAGAQSFMQARWAGEEQAAERRRNAQEQALCETLEDLVTWHDRTGHVLEAEGAVDTLVGGPAAALQGRGFFSQVHVSDRPAFLKALSDAAAGDGTISVQFRIHAAETGQRAEARVTWAEMRARRVQGGGKNEAPLVVAVTRDVSAAIRQQQELESARAETNRVEEAKEQFLATVSHELRTPLNSIIGFSEVLAREAQGSIDPERRKEYLQLIHESGEHLLQVVNALLDVSKIKTGNFEILPEPFEIGAFAHGCCDLMALKAEKAGIVLVRDIATNLPELVADRRACKQILINLLSNAIKFTPPQGHVTVSTQRQGDRILFIVADTGIGIDEKDLPKLGNPFFQAGSSYDRRHEGTGLGLSVVRGLVGLHRGSMTIESAPHKGTSVTVSLPIDCRGGPIQKSAPIPIHTLARPAAEVRALRVG